MPEGFGLQAIRREAGLQLFAGAGLSFDERNERLILGDVFPALDSGRLETTDWGSYLSFASADSVQSVVRAPLTGLPLYWTRRGRCLLCASHLSLLRDASHRPAVDWDYVAQALVFVNLRTERTGVTGIFELLPGSRLDWDGLAVTVTPVWSPWVHVAAARNGSAIDLAPELERRVIASTQAWSASRREIVLELSGGLDSSIVAAALAAAGGDFRAITLATPGADGDERGFARAVAARCSVELIEALHDDSGIDLEAPVRAPGFRPAAYSVLGGIDRAFDAAVPDRNAAIFGGIGGDNIFAFDGTVAPIVDAFESLGYGPRAFRALRDRARAGGATIWNAARLAWRARRQGRRRGWRRDAQYLNDAALPARAFEHPWDEGAALVSQAKRNHVESLRRILDFLDRPGRWHDRDVVAPLLSQPVVEYCLSIPSWTWFEGGRDRMVARAAFAHRLPTEIAWRRGKGRLESLCTAAYLRHRRELAEILLEGRLAAEGLLDRAAIEAYVVQDLVEGNFDYFRLIEIADVERWVRAVEAGA